MLITLVIFVFLLYAWHGALMLFVEEFDELFVRDKKMLKYKEKR